MFPETKLIKNLQSYKSEITDIAFAGLTMYTAHSDGTFSITNTLKKSQKPKIIKAHKNKITSLKVSPYSQFISTTSIDNKLKLYNIKELYKPKQFTFKSYNSCIRNSNFSNDSKLLITAGDDKSLKIFQVYSFRFLTSLKGHTNFVSTCNFMKNSNEKCISGGFDKKVFLWDIKKKKNYFSTKSKGIITTTKFFGEDNYFCVGDNNGEISIFDTRQKEKVQKYFGHKNGVSQIEFDKSDFYFISVGKDCNIKFWDIRKGINIGVLKGGKRKLNCVKFFDDFNFFATAGEDYECNIWTNPFLKNGKEFGNDDCGTKICSLSEKNIDYVNRFNKNNKQKENFESKNILNLKNGKKDQKDFFEQNKNNNECKIIEDKNESYNEKKKNEENINKNENNFLDDPKINQAFDKIIDQLDKLNKTTGLMSKRLELNDKNILELTRFIKKDIEANVIV